jgi:methionyl aminopeptidase
MTSGGTRPTPKRETASNSASPYKGGITIKSEKEMEAMRRAGEIVAATLAALREAVRPGIKTRDLDVVANREIRRHGAVPTFKGYRGFPGCVCTSVNEEIVHGIPGNRVLQEGDLVKMDVGATIDGFIGDAAITVGAGRITPEAEDLIEVTRLSLEEGIKAARGGGRVGDIGAAIQTFAEGRGYSIVREYVGHGVGRFLHEDPQIANYGTAGRGVPLRKGMCIAIEPMVNVGDWHTKVLDDDWTVVTADGKLSAHFEHTIAIRDGDAEILTRPR